MHTLLGLKVATATVSRETCIAMNARATAIYESVLDRSGEISPYTDKKAFWDDIKSVKKDIEAGCKEKSFVPSQVVFVKMLMVAAEKWAVDGLPHDAKKGPTKKRSAQKYVIAGLESTGVHFFKYNNSTVGGLQKYGKLILELEKRIAAGTLSPHAMPDRISDVMFAPFGRLPSMEDRIEVIKSINGPVNKVSITAAMSSRPLDTMFGTSLTDAWIARLGKEHGDAVPDAGMLVDTAPAVAMPVESAPAVATHPPDGAMLLDAAPAVATHPPDGAMLLDAAPAVATPPDAVPEDAMLIDAAPDDAPPTGPAGAMIIDTAPVAAAVLTDSEPTGAIPAGAAPTVAIPAIATLASTSNRILVSVHIVHGSDQFSYSVVTRRSL